MLVLCTLRSTVAFFSLFFTLDMAFMLLGIGYLHRDAMGKPNPPIIKAGGFFALLAAFLAWYNALAGIADDSNRYLAPADLTTSLYVQSANVFVLAFSSSQWHTSHGHRKPWRLRVSTIRRATKWLEGPHAWTALGSVG